MATSGEDNGQQSANPMTGSSQKRSGYLEWEDYFMSIAFLAAKRSKDPETQVGACLVNKLKAIVGVGYNGMPIGLDDDEWPWGRDSEDKLETKYPFVCHAEMNAVMFRNAADVRDCTMYVTLFPCNECAKIIIQAGITEVIFYDGPKPDRYEFQASKAMLEKAGVKLSQFEPLKENNEVKIDLGKEQRKFVD